MGGTEKGFWKTTGSLYHKGERRYLDACWGGALKNGFGSFLELIVAFSDRFGH